MRVQPTVIRQRSLTYSTTPIVQVGRSPRPRSDGVTSVAVWAGSGGSLLLGLDPDVYFTVEMSHVSQLGQRPAAVDAHLVTLQHEVLAAVASGRHVDLWGQTNTERSYLSTLAGKPRS